MFHMMNLIGRYIAEEKLAIAQQYLSPTARTGSGVTEEALEISDDAILALIRGYCRYCIALYCIVLCCIVLCCIVLYCIVLYCIVF